MKKKPSYIIRALMAGTTFLPNAAQAETTADTTQENPTGITKDSGVQDIVVTAERREQSAQRAPLTIQVISGAESLKSGISHVEDVTRLIPAVQIGVGGGDSQIFIRGVGDFSYSALANPGVAFNVDGVYVGRPAGVNGNFYDLSRVEVIKGPQGTLYGRNANGGSINLITNRPEFDQLGGYLNGEVGNYALKSLGGAVNLPISQGLAARFAFHVVDRAGHLSDGSNDDVQQAARMRLRYEANPTVSVLLNADYTHLGGKGGGYVYLPRRPGSSAWEGTSDPIAAAYRDSFQVLTFPSFPANVAPSGLEQDSTLWNISAQLDWKLGFATMTLLPAYRHTDIYNINNIGFPYTSALKSDQQSFEARLGHTSPRLTWVAGLYYFREKVDGYSDVNISEFIQHTHPTYRPLTTSYAAFGQATIAVVERLRLIAGGRYTYEKRSLTGPYLDYRTFGLANPPPPTILFDLNARKTFGAFTYKAGVEFDLAPASLAYLTVSTGFKAGGLNQTNFLPRQTYGPERLRSVEMGLKNRFLNNRLQLNLSAFHWKYSAIQNQNAEVLSPTETNFLFSNVGDATLYGGSLDAIYRPSRADTINLALEYTHSEYDRFDVFTPFYNPLQNGCPVIRVVNGVTFGSCKGFEVARVPKWSGSSSYQHVVNLAANAQLAALASVQFASARWIGTDFISSERDKGYAIFNASLDYTPASGRFSVGAFVRNIGKTGYITSGVERPFIPPVVGASVNEPRVYGIRASLKFGDL